MGLNANLMKVDMTTAGFNYNRNFELLEDNALIDLSQNFNLHNLGVERRGGTSITQAATVIQRVMGGFNFRQASGNAFLVYAKNDGKVYQANDSNVIASGMAVSNFFHFSQADNNLYIADGASTPKKWSGAGLVTSVTPATDFTTTPPFQIIFHPRGASFRNWAINKNGVYASKNNTLDDFADADVTVIPVYSRGGLVAGFEFGQELFVFSKTEAFRIDDSNPDPTKWGYQKAIWEGGASHWRLIVQADNDVYIMTDDLNVYSLQGVFQTGDYRKASVARPAQIDRWLREQTTFPNIENWHAAYDPKLRCIKWFIQVGGTTTNTALVQFIDRDPAQMWAIHNNYVSKSGYGASCSFTYRASVSDWRIYTGDYVGNIWKLEEAARNDQGQSYKGILKWKPWEFKNPAMHKFFPKGLMRIRSATNITLVIYLTVNNIRLPGINFSVASSGGVFDVSTFDNAIFAADSISRTPFDVKTYGETLQMEINHDTANEDFFLAEILMAFKECGLRMYA